MDYFNEPAPDRTIYYISGAIVVVIILAVAAWYFKVWTYFEVTPVTPVATTTPQVKQPYAVVKPEQGFIPGTTVNLYEDAPPGFPVEVILEGKPIYHSSSVNTPDGKKQIVVSYLSDQNPEIVANLYVASLPEKQWTVKSSKVTKVVSVLVTSRGSQNVVITISPGISTTTPSSLVTFQFTP